MRSAIAKFCLATFPYLAAVALILIGVYIGIRL